MSLRAVYLILQRVYIFLDFVWDTLNYRIFGLEGDLEEEPVTGKIAIVTGSNTGIGKQVAKDLADRGATVILACRNLSAGQEALDDIKATVKLARLELMQLDLADLDSVRKFASEFKSRYSELNILINNAGLSSYKSELQKTKQGFELHMGVNHLGHFLLTNLLLDNLKAGAPSRVVNLSSSCLLAHHLRLDDLMLEKFKKPLVFTGMSTLPYNNSKMANALFTKELGKRLQGTGVTTYTLCPGIVKTDVFRDITDWHIKFTVKFCMLIASTPLDKASLGVLFCALSRKCEHETGKFYRFGQLCRKANRIVKAKDAEELWAISERLVQL